MPIGKQKTALIDANRKKENSFNRCQSEKTIFRKASFQRNSTIRRFGFPNDTTDCILRIRGSTFFSTSPISNKMWATLFFREHFSFSTHILSKSKTHYSCNQIRWDIRNLNTEGVNTAPHIKYYNSDVKLRKANQLMKK